MRQKKGGYWAEVPAIPGCVCQGENTKELMENLKEAIEVCLSVDLQDVELPSGARVMEVAV